MEFKTGLQLITATEAEAVSGGGAAANVSDSANTYKTNDTFGQDGSHDGQLGCRVIFIDEWILVFPCDQ